MHPGTSADRPLLVLAAGSMLDTAAETMIRAAADAGFDAVGLRVTGPHWSGSGATLRHLAGDLGVTVHDAEVIRIGDPSTEPGRLIDRAVDIGARSLLVVSDLPDPDATVDHLGRIVDECRAAELTVGLEYMAWTTPSTPDAAIEAARTTGCVVVVDVLHHTRVGADTDALRRIVEADVLGWVQLCDAAARYDGDLVVEARHRRRPPGAGALPLHDLLEVVPIDIPISVEVQSDRLATIPPAERAALLAEATRAVLGGADHGASNTG